MQKWSLREGQLTQRVRGCAGAILAVGVWHPETPDNRWPLEEDRLLALAALRLAFPAIRLEDA